MNKHKQKNMSVTYPVMQRIGRSGFHFSILKYFQYFFRKLLGIIIDGKDTPPPPPLTPVSFLKPLNEEEAESRRKQSVLNNCQYLMDSLTFTLCTRPEYFFWGIPKCFAAPSGLFIKCFVVQNNSEPAKLTSKMFHDPVRNAGICFIAWVKILWPGMQGKKWTTLKQEGISWPR